MRQFFLQFKPDYIYHYNLLKIRMKFPLTEANLITKVNKKISKPSYHCINSISTDASTH